MRSKLFDTFGHFKVWQRPLNNGAAARAEVRQGNRVLFTHMHLHEAKVDAFKRMNAFWDEQARYLKQMQANGEL